MRLTPHRLKACPAEALRPGDHVAVRRREGYTHHGIYLGADRVAHFTDEGGIEAKTRARVTESTLAEFLRGGELLRRRHRAPRHAEEIVARAREVVRGDRPWDGYHLVSNNCEHFATYCATERAKSVQVRQVAVAAAAGVVVAAGFLVRRGPRA